MKLNDVGKEYMFIAIITGILAVTTKIIYDSWIAIIAWCAVAFISSIAYLCYTAYSKVKK